jgi:hypothetical protein
MNITDHTFSKDKVYAPTELGVMSFTSHTGEIRNPVNILGLGGNDPSSLGELLLYKTTDPSSRE